MTDVKLYPYDIVNIGPSVLYRTAGSLSVVEFPFGIQAGGSLAVWSTGFMASESSINRAR